jgi:hypothetical protein
MWVAETQKVGIKDEAMRNGMGGEGRVVLEEEVPTVYAGYPSVQTNSRSIDRELDVHVGPTINITPVQSSTLALQTGTCPTLGGNCALSALKEGREVLQRSGELLGGYLTSAPAKASGL